MSHTRRNPKMAMRSTGSVSFSGAISSSHTKAKSPAAAGQ
jgi:hypothetical protein